MDKKAFEMSFNWIFALVVGGMILFIAVFAAFRFGDVLGTQGNTETVAKIISFFDPMEAGIASGTSQSLEFKLPSMVILRCDSKNDKPFGNEKISFSEKVLGKYSKESVQIPVKNKYVFGKNVTEGREISVLSFPFNMPFKVTDLIIFLNENYCFYKAPDEIKENIENLGSKYINFTNKTNECRGRMVCFDSNVQGCNITVFASCFDSNCEYKYETGKVSKEGKEVYYAGNLVYAAIFSDPDIYDCNVVRIKARADGLYGIYLDKIKVIQGVGCSSTIDLNSLRGTINSSRELPSYYLQSKTVDKVNQAADICKLYKN
jgi:hypothetical protein